MVHVFVRSKDGIGFRHFLPAVANLIWLWGQAGVLNLEILCT
jgi:hypothetical protein